jgi:hypothetical protein
MATARPVFGVSLLPTFLTRLQLLMAIVPGLRDLPKASLDELQTLLRRAEKLIVESMD